MNEPLVTRVEAAEKLGVSVALIRKWQESGKLRIARRNMRGWVMFFESDILALKKGTAVTTDDAPAPRKSTTEPYTPDEAALVFDALDEGKSLVQCVKTCKVMPAIVELLATVYERMNGGLRISKATLDTINTLSLEGTFPLKTEEELLNVLKTAAADVCKGCSTRARSLCKPCAVKFAQQKAATEL